MRTINLSHQTRPSPPPPKLTNPLPCPRCNSTSTKFCNYNNYNTSQPRHFCKACKRYWTHGGSLRNVPVGGGTRKSSKRPRSETETPTNINTPTSATNVFPESVLPLRVENSNRNFMGLLNSHGMPQDLMAATFGNGYGSGYGHFDLGKENSNNSFCEYQKMVNLYSGYLGLLPEGNTGVGSSGNTAVASNRGSGSGASSISSGCDKWQL